MGVFIVTRAHTVSDLIKLEVLVAGRGMVIGNNLKTICSFMVIYS